MLSKGSFLHHGILFKVRVLHIYKAKIPLPVIRSSSTTLRIQVLHFYSLVDSYELQACYLYHHVILAVEVQRRHCTTGAKPHSYRRRRTRKGGALIPWEGVHLKVSLQLWKMPEDFIAFEVCYWRSFASCRYLRRRPRPFSWPKAVHIAF